MGHIYFRWLTNKVNYVVQQHHNSFLIQDRRVFEQNSTSEDQDDTFAAPNPAGRFLIPSPLDENKNI
jgi:hypothetical protein